jgi:hypothetical protein
MKRAYVSKVAQKRIIASNRIHRAAPAMYAALKGLGFRMPPENANCHEGICSQAECGNCSRIKAVLDAISKAEGKE